MYNTGSVEDVAMLYIRTDIFRYLFFPSMISKWNKLDLKIQLSKTLLAWCQSSQSTQFNYNFQDYLNPFCSCSLEVESVSHFFLHCHYYSNIHSTLLNELQSIDLNLLNQEDDIVVEVLLYGSTKFNNNQSFRLLSPSVDYILKSKSCSGSLL